jgi:uncharacterized protein
MARAATQIPRNSQYMLICDQVEDLRRLDRLTRAVEAQREPLADFSAVTAHERAISASLDGRTVFDHASPPSKPRTKRSPQLSLFPD